MSGEEAKWKQWDAWFEKNEYVAGGCFSEQDTDLYAELMHMRVRPNEKEHKNVIRFYHQIEELHQHILLDNMDEKYKGNMHQQFKTEPERAAWLNKITILQNEVWEYVRSAGRQLELLLGKEKDESEIRQFILSLQTAPVFPFSIGFRTRLTSLNL